MVPGSYTHVGVTKTPVLEGEHRIYRPGPDGALGAPDIRPAGTFSENRGDETHVEGGGPDGAIILLSMQAVAGEAGLVDVVTAMSNAEMVVQTVVSVRDRMVQAYNDIIRMPI